MSKRIEKDIQMVNMDVKKMLKLTDYQSGVNYIHGGCHLMT